LGWKHQWRRSEQTNYQGGTALCYSVNRFEMAGCGDPRKLHFKIGNALKSLVLLLCCCLIGAAAIYAAEWTEEKKKAVTEYMQQYRRDWTFQDTELLLKGKVPYAAEAGVFVNGRPIDMGIRTDDGRRIPIEVFGESILVDGKDVSGNLGSKTTYGSHSPIIEDVRNSQITTGNSSPVSKDTHFGLTINLSLSIALSLSFVLNLYLLRKIRSREHPSPRSDDPSKAGSKAAENR
jgi:hypothetical protein